VHVVPRQLNHLFENAGPLAAALAKAGPFRSPGDLLESARAIVFALSEPDRIAVINAHPRIGETPSVVKAQSETSFREQGYDRVPEPPEVMSELARLNAEYERKFGFRFVVFVNRRRKADLVPVLRARMERTREQEMETALGEILAIAADRLAHA
jgi:2-oxo-4-hydroxy-4-carboxy--5-ureidoimidazoline (OHCU) decarboxylase